MGNQFTRNPDPDENVDEGRSCWKRCFSRCFRRRSTIDFGFFDIDEYDYVVEKLAIKYVRVSMFATTYDNYELSRNEMQPQNTSTVLSASVQASPIFPINVSKPESTAKTTRKIRFSKQDIGGKSESTKKPSLAHSIGGTSPAAELMNSLTAFNSHLKESERPPKDPYLLNTTKSQRSFAEELSEVAAQKNYHYPMTESTTSASTTPSTSKQL